ncbi:ATP-binding cassette domain-containing protein [Streptomyces sp. NPDC058092]|uniref:ATP-binding cassette domain-containing protein n=1 Tax=Streptomyces sp. NPDC058092 TaxID=3346336 RepID=UPI0036E157C4
MLGRVGIPDPTRRYSAYPHEFSGGMRQRALIAITLVREPELLIADAPMTALDVTVQAQILDLLNELQAETGTSVILVTHDLGVVAEVCHQVVVMYGGVCGSRQPSPACSETRETPAPQAAGFDAVTGRGIRAARPDQTLFLARRKTSCFRLHRNSARSRRRTPNPKRGMTCVRWQCANQRLRCRVLR